MSNGLLDKETIQQVECPKCNAEPGAPCRSTGSRRGDSPYWKPGQRKASHVERMQAAQRSTLNATPDANPASEKQMRLIVQLENRVRYRGRAVPPRGATLTLPQARKHITELIALSKGEPVSYSRAARKPGDVK